MNNVSKIIEILLFNDIVEERFILNAGKAYYKDIFSLISKKLNKPAPKIKAKAIWEDLFSETKNDFNQ